ncbi:MAG: lipopolysaccharide biosynthesis protein [bacterium]
MPTLRKQTIHAMSWSALETLGLTILQFVFSIIMARLLTPEQYGLIAVLGVFITLAQTFVDSGFGSALIQKREPSQTDITTVFVFNMVIAVVCVGAVCGVAPWIAGFYGQPILRPMACVLSMGIVINALCLIQFRLMTKRLDFKTQAKIGLGSTLFSGVVGVLMAMNGFGVWSLVAQQLCSHSVRGILLWGLNPWRPSGHISLASLREMAPFGSRILGIGLLETVFKNLNRLVIAKLFSPADLGYVERAHSLSDMPISGLTSMLNKVMFPVMATIQDDFKRLKSSLRTSVAVLAWVLFPATVGLIVVAEPLVLILLTRKWAASIPYLRLCCIDLMVYPLYVVHLSLLKAIGRSDLVLRTELVRKGLVLISLLVTYRWGIMAMMAGYALVSVVSFVVIITQSGRLVGYRIREQAIDLVPYVMGALLMGLMAWLSGWIPYPNLWLKLISQIAVGSAGYLLLSIMFRWKAVMQITLALYPYLGTTGQSWARRLTGVSAA